MFNDPRNNFYVINNEIKRVQLKRVYTWEKIMEFKIS